MLSAGFGRTNAESKEGTVSGAQGIHVRSLAQPITAPLSPSSLCFSPLLFFYRLQCYFPNTLHNYLKTQPWRELLAGKPVSGNTSKPHGRSTALI